MNNILSIGISNFSRIVYLTPFFLVISYYLISKKRLGRNKITSAELNEFRRTHAKINLTKEQERLLTFGAIYSLMPINGRTVLLIEPAIRKEVNIEGNQKSWGVYNTDDAREALGDLLARKTTTLFDSKLHKMPEIKQYQKKIAKRLGINISEVEKTTSTYAWDVCRAVNMSRDFYFADLISVEEMWEVMKAAVDVAEHCGTGWTDSTVSFLLGRLIHGFGIEDTWTYTELLYGKPKKIKDIDVYKRFSFK